LHVKYHMKKSIWYSRSELGIHKSKVLQIYEIYIADWTQIKLIALFREGIIYDGLILVRALLHKWFKLFSLYSVASQRNIFTTFIRYITNSLLRAAFVDSRLRAKINCSRTIIFFIFKWNYKYWYLSGAASHFDHSVA